MQAMTKMHEAGYYHRDIKPQNLVVSGFDGKKLCGKVIDWACARQFDERTFLSHHVANLLSKHPV